MKTGYAEAHRRVRDAFAAAGIYPDLRVVFTGDVQVVDNVYDPDDEAMSALREAADAAFPVTDVTEPL